MTDENSSGRRSDLPHERQPRPTIPALADVLKSVPPQRTYLVPMISELFFRSGTSVVLRSFVGRALHQHKLHLSQVYGLFRDQAHRIFLKNGGLVFHKGE